MKEIKYVEIPVILIDIILLFMNIYQAEYYYFLHRFTYSSWFVLMAILTIFAILLIMESHS